MEGSQDDIHSNWGVYIAEPARWDHSGPGTAGAPLRDSLRPVKVAKVTQYVPGLSGRFISVNDREPFWPRPLFTRKIGDRVGTVSARGEVTILDHLVARLTSLF